MTTSFALPVPAGLSEQDLAIFKLILGRGGKLKSSKPKIDKNDPNTGKAAYVWRMVAFMVSENRQHHCMPTTADFDLPAYVDGKWSCRGAQQMADDLQPLVKAITNAVPLRQSSGALHWGRAFGMI